MFVGRDTRMDLAEVMRTASRGNFHRSQAAIKLYPAPAVNFFFSMDSTPSWDLYCISAGYQDDILERSEKIEQIQNGRHLVKVKL